MKVDLLAIAAHPDDAELTSGGTLLKMAAAGYRTGVLDLTRGETGTRGTPETRLKEATRAAKIMRLAVRRNLGLPDAHLEIREEYKMAIAEVIRELQPRTVILPYWEGRHPDHYTAAQLGFEACFVAGLRNYPLGGEAYRPFKILYAAAYEYHQGIRTEEEGDIGVRFAIYAAEGRAAVESGIAARRAGGADEFDGAVLRAAGGSEVCGGIYC
jgi:bacillithiol biosynthesis deacetylase BshB1